ncbi:hypothetical protein COU54_02170 [Candidatus Pacearchaeota archaeon CG10_big_fil_rev_8_21_14_0_10_31_24]|nr:MAG: hypothetical protein COU54_02170 [Candidatus Pacearchaeota archaeon CG10_big_fil_rev_8_21_14_0_10_31_24]
MNMNMNIPFVIMSSMIGGKGAFAIKDIKKGEVLCFMNGNEFFVDKIHEKEINEEENRGDSLQIGDHEYIDLDEKYRCINHSCEPNSFLKGKNELIALKNMEKDEEITYDYSATMFEDKDLIKEKFGEELWIMKCKCGNENCRNIIGQFYELPEELKMKYVDNCWLQDYILKKYKLKF